jgi:hypothetical protein
MSNRFKYQNEIEKVKSLGLKCPPEDLFVPNGILAFRFTFEDTESVKNHLPPGVMNPQRILKVNDHTKCSLYGLSCFKRMEGAMNFFAMLLETNPRFHKAVGSNLSSGIINDDDGMITKEDKHSHFDLFEFVNCNLSTKFKTIEKLHNGRD